MIVGWSWLANGGGGAPGLGGGWSPVTGGMLGGGMLAGGTLGGGTLAGAMLAGGTLGGGMLAGGTLAGGTLAGGTLAGGTLAGGWVLEVGGRDCGIGAVMPIIVLPLSWLIDTSQPEENRLGGHANTEIRIAGRELRDRLSVRGGALRERAADRERELALLDVEAREAPLDPGERAPIGEPGER
ncbi:MAG TPA: hypothetical protein VN253_07885, partial [Kofleriaceae bacterium]|nr:hypothetical protein [Kofleriaceae bacterium]